MFMHEATKKNAGIILWGDQWELRELNELIHKANEHSPLVANKEGYMLGLASDVRKSIEKRCRKSEKSHYMPI